MIGCIFAENGPLESGIESSFWDTAGVLRVISYVVLTYTRTFLDPLRGHFPRGPPNIFRKHVPSGIGTERLGMIGCIFAENGPLKVGIESSFWGTGWGAKGDFIRFSYLYPCIFESRIHTFFESTCPELYAQQSWECSDAYSWRNDISKVNLCGFARSRPESLRLRLRKFGNYLMYIRGEWALRNWHWIKFLGYRLGC